MVREEFISQKGITLLSLALCVLVISMFFSVALNLYSTYTPFEASADTEDKLSHIQDSLEEFYAKNGRYPCVARFTAAIDSNNFGKEVSNDCTSVTPPGTFHVTGRDGKGVKIGTLPVRTLNLPDSYMFDGYRQRFVYAITEEYAQDGMKPDSGLGAIYVQDPEGHPATSEDGNMVRLVFSMGSDTKGAYSMEGTQIEPCDGTVRAGENCDFDDAVFINTLEKSTNTADASYFAHKMFYGISAPQVEQEVSCEDDPTESKFKNLTFLIDTSASMEEAGSCPATMERCSKMDVARWAMRRVMPGTIYQAEQSSTPGKISMTGFVSFGSPRDVARAMEDADTVFYDPNVKEKNSEGRSEEAAASELNTKLLSMCPSGLTPLGTHLDAISEDLGNGVPGCEAEDDPEVCDPEDEGYRRPNKIILISDGKNTWGRGTGGVTAYVDTHYPELDIDVIDVGGDRAENLDELAVNKGKYYTADTADELLTALYHAIGGCGEKYVPSVPPVDETGCGSATGGTTRKVKGAPTP